VNVPGYGLRLVSDAKEWNTLVQSLPGADLRQGFEWGQLRAARGWRASRLALFDGPTAVAACSVLTWRLPPLGAVMYVPRGPLWRADAPGALARLLEELHVLAWRRCAVFMRVSPGVSDHDVEGELARNRLVPLEEESTTWNTPRAAQTLDLTGDEGTLLQRIRRRFREHIRSAARKELSVERTTRTADLEAFHALLLNTGRVKGIPVRTLAHYRALARLYGPTGALTLLVARADDHIVGGVLGVQFGSSMTMLHTAVRAGVSESLKHSVAPVIFWDLIRRAKAAGCAVLDLGSSGVGLTPRTTDSGWGVYHFKAGLGARLQAAPRFHDLVLRPTAYRLVRLAERQMMPQMWRLAAHASMLVPWRARRAPA
jgi:lipid II:glycine glycyltransferase (peptidoglycan interpeptide bridge formation enzyme)